MTYETQHNVNHYFKPEELDFNRNWLGEDGKGLWTRSEEFLQYIHGKRLMVNLK